MASSPKLRATPTSSAPTTRSGTPRPPTTGPPHQNPTNDHTVSNFRHKLSQREYPSDCPPLNVRWYYAVDVPKRKPFAKADPSGKPPKQPSKYVPFELSDSRAIETAFQRLSEEEDAAELDTYTRRIVDDAAFSDIGEMGKNAAVKEREVKVPVNEDFLFDVDIKKRELEPVYWLGPAYDVRRGTWFYQDGSSLRPCDENLATQVEEGYLNIKPFRTVGENKKPKTVPSEANNSPSPQLPPDSSSSFPFLGKATTAPKEGTVSAPQQQTWRLFGAHLNSFVVYVDQNTAWLLTDDFYGKLTATVWQRMSAGTHMGGVKLVRGYTEPAKALDKKPEKASTRPTTPTAEEEEAKEVSKNKRKSMPPPATSQPSEEVDPKDRGRLALERKMSSYAVDSRKSTEELLESEMKEDYRADVGDDQGREIEHLLLVTHGIGQKLSMRMESVNFVHDVNVLRKTLKGVYGVSPDLQVLNDEIGEGKKKNCRIQCLPVCWRHLLDFPNQSLRQNRGEHDLSTGSRGSNIENEYPSLEEITVEGVPAVRQLMTDLALDVLLYQSTTYREHIIRTVQTECNRIYALFKERNPEFKGKVSLVGHSLGSAILFDILCRQPDSKDEERTRKRKVAHGKQDILLDFPVENIFCLGSPVGLFQMLKGRTIAARSHVGTSEAHASPLSHEFTSDPFSQSSSSNQVSSSIPTSSPKVGQLFNIFHPSDPISYRIEPLVSKAMAQLKAQPLPYTKRTFFSSNGQLVGGISGIGQSVTRGVTNMWSSLSSGIASSILNRSLGFNGSGAPASSSAPTAPEEKKELMQSEGTHPPTMIDADIETLYSGFQKRRQSTVEGSEEEEADAEEEAARLRHEEEKVRALNATGRIDFAIQEGVFDISLIASIASHLSYWGDEDVNHFVISQLLSRQRVMKRSRAASGTGVLGNGWTIKGVR